jgi:hypothetical protein
LNGKCLFFWDTKCQLSRRYAEGSSWHATEVADQCYVGGYHESPIKSTTKESVDNDTTTTTANDDNNALDPLHPAAARTFELKFGCQSAITGLFIEQLADGIMGIDAAPTSYWWQMYSAQQISRRAFALCMGRADYIDVPVGVLSLGGTNPILHDRSSSSSSSSPMVYATMNPSTLYNVQIRAMYLQMPDNNNNDNNKSSWPTFDSSPPLRLGGADHDDQKFVLLDKVIVDSGTFYVLDGFVSLLYKTKQMN